MPLITDYASLQENVGDFLNRQDLAPVIPTFIQLAESQMRRRIEVFKADKTATLTFTDGVAPMPTDFLRTKYFCATYEPFDQLSARAKSIGTPAYFGLSGGNMSVSPQPEDATELELTYEPGLPALSDTATTNWLLDGHPDAYLYGALTQTAPYLKADERIGVWGEFFMTAIDDINEASRNRIGERLQMRSAG